MRSKQFANFGWNVPAMGQGTWNLAAGDKAAEQAAQAIRAGIELGMTHLDTAEMYDSGLSEEIIARAKQGIERDRLFIVTKVLPENASFEGTVQACERSLSRLQTDYIDCYLLHWRGSHPIGETMRAMETLIEQGKIRSLGVSNFDVEDLEEAQQTLKKNKIACNQVLYHLKERGIERALLPYCQKHSISVVGYTPFGKQPPPDESTESGATLHAVARKHNATVRQVILAFLIRAEGTFAIPKAAQEKHTNENAQAADLILDPDDIARIDQAFPAPQRRTPLAWA